MIKQMNSTKRRDKNSVELAQGLEIDPEITNKQGNDPARLYEPKLHWQRDLALHQHESIRKIQLAEQVIARAEKANERFKRGPRTEGGLYAGLMANDTMSHEYRLRQKELIQQKLDE